MRRKIRDEADARKCLAGVERAGGDSVAWAREHGVDARSLNAWRVNLGRRGTKRRGPPLSLVELVPPTQAATARYALEVGGVRVEFDDGFAPETLRRVVAALRPC